MAPVYLTSVLEYAIAEIFEMAGQLVKMMDDRSSELKITPRHIRLVIQNDDELREVFKGAILPSSGGGALSSRTLRKFKCPTHEDTEDEEEDTGRRGARQGSRAKSSEGRTPSTINCSEVLDLIHNSYDEEEEQQVRPKMKMTHNVREKSK